MTTTPQAVLLSALAEFNRYFASANGVDVSARISVPRDEWRALHAAILTKLQATQAEPVRARWYSLATLCSDEEDARQTAIENSIQWPNLAPHRAVQMAPVEPVQAGELPDERAAFEQWASGNGELPRAVARSGDVYHLMATQTYWLAWKARAALSARKPLTPLTPAQMEKGRDQIFSINNPFCPCNSKTFSKVAEWVERHHGIGLEAKP